MFGTDVLIALAFVAALGVVFILAKAARHLVIALSPGEWLYTVILTFSMGVLAAAYLDGDGTLMLVALIPVFIGIIWWIARALLRHQGRTTQAQGV
jgi:hypothetical protein